MGNYRSIGGRYERRRKEAGTEVIMIEGIPLIVPRYTSREIDLDKVLNDEVITVGLLGEDSIGKVYFYTSKKEKKFEARVPRRLIKDFKAMGWAEGIAIKVKRIDKGWVVVGVGHILGVGDKYRDGVIIKQDEYDLERVMDRALEINISSEEQNNRVIVFTPNGLRNVGTKWFKKARESVQGYKTNKIKFVFVGDEDTLKEKGFSKEDFDLVVQDVDSFAVKILSESQKWDWKNFSIHQSTVVIAGQGEELPEKFKEKFVCVQSIGTGDYYGARLLIFALNLIINKDKGISAEMQKWATALGLRLLYPKGLVELIKDDLEEIVRSRVQT